MIAIWYLVAFLFVLSLALLWWSSRRQKTSGLPAGRIIYSDNRQWSKAEKVLYDPQLGLAGRPDYLVQQGDRTIPVEVKSGQTPESPYDAHIYQLAAYLRLVEVNYPTRPPYGILAYPKHTFAIDYTAELEQALSVLVEEMRTADHPKAIDRSHNQPQRCKGCGYRSVCDQKLV